MPKNPAKGGAMEVMVALSTMVIGKNARYARRPVAQRAKAAFHVVEVGGNMLGINPYIDLSMVIPLKIIF